MSASRPLASTSARVGSSYVVAVGAVDGPADGHAVAFGGNGPLPSQLGSIRWVRAGSLATTWRLVQRPVEGDVVEVEADDPIERGERFGLERLEHAGGDPLIASCSQGGVRDLVFEDRFDVDPRRTGHQANQQASEAEPVRCLRAVAAEGVARSGGGSSGSTVCQMTSATSV